MQHHFFILLGLGLGLIAGVMAYLITYEEYQHHFKGKRVFLESIKKRSNHICFLCDPGSYSWLFVVIKIQDFDLYIGSSKVKYQSH